MWIGKNLRETPSQKFASVLPHLQHHSSQPNHATMTTNKTFVYQNIQDEVSWAYPLIPNMEVSRTARSFAKGNCTNMNRILYWSSHRQAGLTDRTKIIHRLHAIACVLKAKVVIGTPHELLHPKHNQGHEVSKRTTWETYMEFPMFTNTSGSWQACPLTRHCYQRIHLLKIIRSFHPTRKSFTQSTTFLRVMFKRP